MKSAQKQLSEEPVLRTSSPATRCAHRGRRKSKGISPNELTVPLDAEGLAPHIRVVKASRSSLTYDRME